MMNRRCLAALAGVIVTLGGPGCGNPAGFYPVHGTVLYKGKPAAGAVVYFHQDGRRAAAPTTAIPSGVVDDNGTFSLACDGVGAGCPPGRYAVLVEWRDSTGDGVVPVKGKGNTKLVKRSRVRSGPDRLNGRYFNGDKPLIYAEVLPQSNSLAPFELGG
jgi:hypothetical protein